MSKFTVPPDMTPAEFMLREFERICTEYPQAVNTAGVQVPELASENMSMEEICACTFVLGMIVGQAGWSDDDILQVIGQAVQEFRAGGENGQTD